MNELVEINKAVLAANVRLGKLVGLEITVFNEDWSTTMSGEPLYLIIIEGEVAEEFLTITEAIEGLKCLTE